VCKTHIPSTVCDEFLSRTTQLVAVSKFTSEALHVSGSIKGS